MPTLHQTRIDQLLPSGTFTDSMAVQLSIATNQIQSTFVSPREQSINKRRCYGTVDEEACQLCKCRGSNSSCGSMAVQLLFAARRPLSKLFHHGSNPTTGEVHDTEDEVACQDTPVSRIKQLICVTLIKIVPHPEPIHYQEQRGHSIIYPRSNPTSGPREQSHDTRSAMTQKMK